MSLGIADIEADGLLDTLTQAWCVVVKDARSGEVREFTCEDGEGWLDRACDYLDTFQNVVFHNGLGYDIPALERLTGRKLKFNCLDSMRVSQLVHPRWEKQPRPWGYKGKGGTHSLDCWGYRVRRWKPSHEDWSQFSQEMLHRCCEDVEITHLVWKQLIQDMKALGGMEAWRPALELTHRIFHIAFKQEQYGWYMDREHILWCIDDLETKMREISEEVEPNLPFVYDIKEGGTKAKPNYVKQPFLKTGKPNTHMVKYWGDEVGKVGGPHTRIEYRNMRVDKDEIKDYLLSQGWQPREWNTDKAGNQTSPKIDKNETFEGLEGGYGQRIALRAQYKARLGIIKGYLRRIREDGRQSSRITGYTETYRMAHADVVNTPNCEALYGPEMRKCYTHAPGKILVSADAASCQDRFLGDRSKDESLVEMLLNGNKTDGTDSHSVAMTAVNSVHKRHDIPLITRGKAKNYNYGFKFGASDNKLGAMSNAGKDIGTEIRAALVQVFRGMQVIIDMLNEEWESNAEPEATKWGLRFKNGWFAGLDGRPICVESPHALLVYALQSDESIMMGRAYCDLHDRLINDLGLQWGTDWAFVNWNHDEFTIECEPKHAKLIAKEMEDAIANAGLFYNNTFCPQAGEAAIGHNWAEVH